MLFRRSQVDVSFPIRPSGSRCRPARASSWAAVRAVSDAVVDREADGDVQRRADAAGDRNGPLLDRPDRQHAALWRRHQRLEPVDAQPPRLESMPLATLQVRGVDAAGLAPSVTMARISRVELGGSAGRVQGDVGASRPCWVATASPMLGGPDSTAASSSQRHDSSGTSRSAAAYALSSTVVHETPLRLGVGGVERRGRARA